ncbi:MAG TPA: DUF3300 domain-containing protein [Methylomirabilota bacterium]|nr:DUF3300 domain-containing protein [Methylomirabilota bacterium]
MRILRKIVATVVAVVLMIPATLIAQELPRPIPFSPVPFSPVPFSNEDLEQLAAPVALYPDPLLAQVLMAATYPVEVVQAARFVQANPTLRDSRLGEALRYQNWDDSVKALVSFPQILAMMDGKLDWTQRLGDAFLAQEQDLMDAVQVLRARAQAQGTLTSSPQQVVTMQAPYIYIQPASPQVIYVPVYNPLIVFGPWPYPARQPYYYRPAGWPVATGFFGLGGGIFVGFGLWGTCDWHRHVVFVDVARYRRFTEVVNVEGRRGGIEHGRIGPREGDRLAWQHDVRHRENVEVRHTAAQQHVAAPRPAVVPSREPFRGRVEQPRVEQPRAEQPRVEQRRVEHPRAEQPRAGQPRVEQPRAEQGRPQPGRGGQEAVRPSVQPAPRPESSRPQPGDSPRVQARVQANPGPAPAQRREPGERGHENRESVAPTSPSVRNAHVAAVATGSVHEASSPSASSGSVQGGGARR